MRAIICAAIMLSFSGVMSAADDNKIDVKKLLGKWEPAKSKNDEKVVIEFAENGKLTVQVTIGDKTEKVDGSYKLDGNKLTTVMTFKGKEKKETITITKLTDDEMVSKDSSGEEETLKKLKQKK